MIGQAAAGPPQEDIERKLMTQGFLLGDGLLAARIAQGIRAGHYAVRRRGWTRSDPAEKTDPDWIMLKLQLAKANRALADQLQAKDPRDPQIKKSRDEPRASWHATWPGAGQQPGGSAIPVGQYSGRCGRGGREQKPAATTFEEAKTTAIEAVSEMQSEQAFLKELPNRLERETDAGIKEELQQQKATAEESVTRNRAVAMENLLLALQLADAKTPLDDLNLVRRLLAYLHYMQEDYYDAAVLGEFVGRKFPGRPAHELVRRSRSGGLSEALRSRPNRMRKEFATQHIVSLANFIVDTWAGSPEAADAINTLIPFLISRGEMAKAREYVQGMPENSPQRASAELRMGESLWRDYLVGMDQVRQWEREVQEPDAAKDELNAQHRAAQTGTGGTQAERTERSGDGRGTDAAVGHDRLDGAAGRAGAGADLRQPGPGTEGHCACSTTRRSVCCRWCSATMRRSTRRNCGSTRTGWR